MTDVSLDQIIRIGPDVVFKDLDGEAVILNLATGMYHGLDAVGTRMWSLIHELGSLRKVFDVLLEEYEVSPKNLEGDLLTLARELCARGLAHAST